MCNLNDLEVVLSPILVPDSGTEFVHNGSVRVVEQACQPFPTPSPPLQGTPKSPPFILFYCYQDILFDVIQIGQYDFEERSAHTTI